MIGFTYCLDVSDFLGPGQCLEGYGTGRDSTASNQCQIRPINRVLLPVAIEVVLPLVLDVESLVLRWYPHFAGVLHAYRIVFVRDC